MGTGLRRGCILALSVGPQVASLISAGVTQRQGGRTDRVSRCWSAGGRRSVSGCCCERLAPSSPSTVLAGDDWHQRQEHRSRRPSRCRAPGANGCVVCSSLVLTHHSLLDHKELDVLLRHLHLPSQLSLVRFFLSQSVSERGRVGEERLARHAKNSLTVPLVDRETRTASLTARTLDPLLLLRREARADAAAADFVSE